MMGQRQTELPNMLWPVALVSTVGSLWVVLSARFKLLPADVPKALT